MEEKATEPKDKENFSLSTILPANVIGPICLPAAKTSMQLIARPMSGKDPAVMDMLCPLVDVRDVVEAHIQAAKRDEAAGKRFLLVDSGEGEMYCQDMNTILQQEFGPKGYKIPTARMPNWLVWIMSCCSRDIAAFYPLLGVSYQLDNSRSKEILGLKYDRPIRDTLIDAGHSLIEHGIVPKTKLYVKSVTK